MRLGVTEIILILVLALVIFGGSKLRNVGGDLGKAIKDFKDAVKSGKKDDSQDEAQAKDSDKTQE